MAFERDIIYRIRDAAFKRHKREMEDFTRNSTKGIEGVTTRFQRFGRVLRGAAISAGVGLLIALGDALRRGVSQAKDFEDAMIGVRKTTGLSGAPLRELEKGIIEVSKRLGVASDELATYAEVAGQLGIRGNEAILSFTETAAKLSEVSDLSAEEAANSVAKISRAFNIAITESERVGSVLNELSNTTAATAGELADALRRIGTAGSSVGFTVSQVAALSATLIDNGIRARVAGTSLRNIFVQMQTSAEDLAEQMGITSEEFSNMVSEDAEQALLKYLGHLNSLDKQTRAIQIEEIFGKENFLAVNTLASATERLAENTDVAGRAFRENTSLAVEFATSLESFTGQFGLFTQRIREFTQGAGMGLLNWATSALEAFNKLTAGPREMAEAITLAEAETEGLNRNLKLLQEYEELKFSAEGTDEFERLQVVTTKLQELFPNYVTDVNAAGEATGFYVDALRRQIESQKELTRLQRLDTIKKLAKEFREAREDVDDLTDSIDSAQDRYTELSGKIADLQRLIAQGIDVSRNRRSLRDYEDALADTERELQNNIRTLSSAKSEAQGYANTLIGLYGTQDNIDTQAFVSDLRLAEVGMMDAQRAAVFLSTAYREVEEAASEAGTSVQSLVGVDHSQTEPEDDDEDDGPTEEELEEMRRAAEERRQELERLAEVQARVTEAVERYRRAVTGASDYELEVLGELQAAKREQEQVEKDRADLVAANADAETAIFDEREQQLQDLIEHYRTVLDRLGDMREAAQGVSESLSGAVKALESGFDTGEGFRADLAASKLRQVQRAQEQYLETLQDIRDEVALRQIDEEEAAERIEAATAEYTAELQSVYDWLERLGLLTPEVKRALADAMREAEEGAEGANDEGNKMVDTLGSIAAGARGVLRLADAFSDVDDQVRETIESIADLAEGIGRVIENPGDIGGWIQAIGGAVGTVTGLLGPSDEELEERRRQREEMQRLRLEIEDNSAAIKRSTEAYLEAAQIGFNVTPEEERALSDAYDTLAHLLTRFEIVLGPGGTPIEQPVQISEQDARSALQDLEQALADAGIDIGVDLIELFDQMLEQEGETPRTALRRLLEGFDDFEGGLSAFFDDLLGSLGTFSNTIEGQIARARDEIQFTGAGGESLLDDFLQNVLDNVPELSQDARDIVNQILGLDRRDFDSDEDFQAAVAALVEDLYNLGAESGLSADSLRALLDAILGFAADVEEARDQLGVHEEGETEHEFGLLDVSLETFRRAVDAFNEALEYGAITLDEALDQLIAAVRAAADGGLSIGAFGQEGNSVLDRFLNEIDALDLTSQAGQDRLADIIRQLYRLGPGALGLEREIFLAMLDELQSLGNSFEVVAGNEFGMGPVPGEDEESSAAFRVSRQITEYQANRMIDILEAILFAIRGQGLPTPTPPAPVSPRPVHLRPEDALPPVEGRPYSPVDPRPPKSGNGWVTVQVREGEEEALAEKMYPHVVRRIGSELRRTYRN